MDIFPGGAVVATVASYGKKVAGSVSGEVHLCVEFGFSLREASLKNLPPTPTVYNILLYSIISLH